MTVQADSPRWTTPEAARYIGCSVRKLEKDRQTGSGPVYLKVGRLVFYRKSDIDNWLEQCKRTSTSGAE